MNPKRSASVWQKPSLPVQPAPPPRFAFQPAIAGPAKPAALKPPIQPGVKRDLAWESDRDNPVRYVAFLLALAMIFIRITFLQELLIYITKFNTYVLFIVGIPAIVLALATGGIRRTLSSNPPRYWMGFFFCMSIAVVMSQWRGGSFAVWSDYVKAVLPMLFIAGGSAVTWKEARSVMNTLVAAAFLSVLSAQYFMRGSLAGRIELSFGSISNSNDIAAHLLGLVPFFLFVVIAPKRASILRLFAVMGIAMSMYIILNSGSRGALIAIFVAFAVALAYLPMKARVLSLVLVPIVLLVALAFTSSYSRNRLFSIFDKNLAQDEASESTTVRSALFFRSLQLTLEYPLFGVGPGRFSEMEAERAKAEGKTRGLWQQAHNSYTQISTECGIPAFLFFVAGVVSSIRLLMRTYKKIRYRPEFREMSQAIFCMLLSMVGFGAAIAFINFAYVFYLPTMIGIACVLSRAAEKEIANPVG